MKKNVLISVFAVICILCASCSGHHNHTKGEFDAHFGDMDLNEDEKLSFEEFKKKFSHGDMKTFNGIDEDKDGFVSHDEWHSFKESKGYKNHD